MTKGKRMILEQRETSTKRESVVSLKSEKAAHQSGF
jgi:hypothetical protein